MKTLRDPQDPRREPAIPEALRWVPAKELAESVPPPHPATTRQLWVFATSQTGVPCRSRSSATAAGVR